MVRFGKSYKEISRVVSAYGSSLNTGVETIQAQYASGNEDIAINNLPQTRESYRSVHNGYLTALQSVITTTTTNQVNRDTPLSQQNINAALTELIRQMNANGDSLNRPTISSALTPASSNYGDGTFVTSMFGTSGQPQDMCFAENIRFTCTSDSYSSGATAFKEVYSFKGQPTKSVFDYQWGSSGSGASGTVTLFDAGTQNDLISNGGFDTWTNSSAAPDNGWAVVGGTFGTNLTRSTSVKRGQYSLAMTSDGSTLLGFKQQLSTSIVKPNQVICFKVWMKKSANDSSGTVVCKLVDGSGTTISSDASVANTKTFTLASSGDIGSSFTGLSTSFVTPKVLPASGVFLEIIFGVSPANAVVVTVDLVGLKVGTPMYAGGPSVAGFSAATANAVNDYSTLAVSNNATTNYFVKAVDRIYGVRQMGLFFPSSGSPTVNDSLLT